VDRVKQMIEAGVSLSTAIKEALPASVSEFCDQHGLTRPVVSDMINLVRAPDLRLCAALSKELGGEPYEWAMLLWEHAKPSADRFPVAA